MSPVIGIDPPLRRRVDPSDRPPNPRLKSHPAAVRNRLVICRTCADLMGRDLAVRHEANNVRFRLLQAHKGRVITSCSPPVECQKRSWRREAVSRSPLPGAVPPFTSASGRLSSTGCTGGGGRAPPPIGESSGSYSAACPWARRPRSDQILASVARFAQRTCPSPPDGLTSWVTGTGR